MNEVIQEHTYPAGKRLQLVRGDITTEAVGAIVNAANAHLQHGGGVAAVIARKGGRVIRDESNAWVREHGPVSHSQPAYTRAGNLPCRYVIHAVGPVWGDGDEDAKLAAAVRGSMERAVELELDSLALPAISTGIFSFPKARAAGVIFEAIEDYFSNNPETPLELVRLILYDRPTLDAFTEVWEAHSLSGGAGAA